MKKEEIIRETKWNIDSSHSEIGFKVRHMMIANIKGTFGKFDASIYTSDKDFTTATVDLWIDAASINTGDAKRDEHLRSEDFLDIAQHKQITFTSSTLGKADHSGNQELWGELTIKEITKNVKLNIQFGGTATDSRGDEKAGFTVTGKINRSEWGLEWNSVMETGGIMVGDEIIITCEIEIVNVVNSLKTMVLDA